MIKNLKDPCNCSKVAKRKGVGSYMREKGHVKEFQLF